MIDKVVLGQPDHILAIFHLQSDMGRIVYKREPVPHCSEKVAQRGAGKAQQAKRLSPHAALDKA